MSAILNCPSCGHPEQDHDYGRKGSVTEIPCKGCPGGVCVWKLRPAYGNRSDGEGNRGER